MKTPSRNQFATSRSLPGRVLLTCEFDIRKFLRFNQLTQFAFDANQFELGGRRPPLASRGALPYNISVPCLTPHNAVNRSAQLCISNWTAPSRLSARALPTFALFSTTAVCSKKIFGPANSLLSKDATTLWNTPPTLIPPAKSWSSYLSLPATSNCASTTTLKAAIFHSTPRFLPPMPNA